MNYKIIVDEAANKAFINALPHLDSGECFYLCLFARSKYAKNEDGSNKFPHIKTDKNQLKRFVSKKEDIFNKIRQLETEFGTYLTKDGQPVPQEALALYININPRDQRKALFTLQKRLIDILECKGEGYNVNAEAMSAIQKSKSKSHYVDFDIDSKDIDLSLLEGVFGHRECYHILETRGGYHILVEVEKIKRWNSMGLKTDTKWHQRIQEIYNVDQSGDQMIPMPGTYQGGFIPRFITT